MDKKIIYIIAGESSGDFIGAKLMQQLKLINANFVFKGIGGDLMEKEGLKSFFNIKEIAIMGFIEVFLRAFKLKKLIKNTIEDIKRVNPDIIITIDSLGFNKRVVSSIKQQQKNLTKKAILLHYVAPTVWAWKPKRAKEIAAIYDYLLCLFDFEVPYFEKEGLKTYFVGHPIIESMAEMGNKYDLLKKYSLKEDSTYILLMPGSRSGEIKRLLPIFAEVVNNLTKRIKNIKVILPTVPHMENEVKEYLKNNNLNYLVILDRKDKFDSFKLASLAIAASGTVSLELALGKVPMVIAYKVNSITAFIAKFLIKVKYASIINIIAKKEIIKECIQEKCNVHELTECAINIIENKHNTNFDAQVLEILSNLGYKKYLPSQKAAKVIEEILLRQS